MAQLVTESALLALVGRPLGLVLARLERRRARRGRAGRIAARWAEIGIDARVLALCARRLGRVEPPVRRAAGAAGVARRSQPLAAPGRPRRRARRRRRAVPQRAGGRGDRAGGRARRRRVAADPQLHRARPRRRSASAAITCWCCETSVPTRIDLRNIAGAQRATAFYADAAAAPGGGARRDLGRRHSRAARGAQPLRPRVERRLLARRRAGPGDRRRPAAAGGVHGGDARLLQDDGDPDPPRPRFLGARSSSTRRLSRSSTRRWRARRSATRDPIGRQIACGLDSPRRS